MTIRTSASFWCRCCSMMATSRRRRVTDARPWASSRRGGRTAPWIIPIEHLIVTANVSIIALFVAVLTARAALQVRHYPTLLIAIGFMTMAGIFAVHGLSTPGVIQRGSKADDAGLVVGISAQLALWCSSVFFALR